jgi:predicted metal-binding membrane protein
MMLSTAAPAIARHARTGDEVRTVPLFAAAYLAMWLLTGLAIAAVYRPPADAVAIALVVGGLVYELSPLKRNSLRRCRECQRSGAWLGIACVASSLGLMAVLVALDPMSLPLMGAVGAIVLIQKELLR